MIKKREKWEQEVRERRSEKEALARTFVTTADYF
jgi:hypothetical protein